ncbi:unnamed protein product, partial [Urochloa humidicola]
VIAVDSRNKAIEFLGLEHGKVIVWWTGLMRGVVPIVLFLQYR